MAYSKYKKILLGTFGLALLAGLGYLAWAGRIKTESKTPPLTTQTPANTTSKPFAAEKPANDRTPRWMVLEGQYVCLPHRNTSGPQTEECAFGLKTNDGVYYFLDTNVLQPRNVLMELKTGDRIKVDGRFTPIEMVSSMLGKIYPVTGIISVTSIQNMKD